MSGASLVATTIGSGPLSVELFGFPYGFRYGPGSLQTGFVTPTVSGGAPPYSFSWVKDSGDAIGISSATAPSVLFVAFAPSTPQTYTAGYTVTVTDSAGQSQPLPVFVQLDAL